jgi:hypothetical protein
MFFCGSIAAPPTTTSAAALNEMTPSASATATPSRFFLDMIDSDSC